jgi:uncharacterized protein YydD (DUF2326 family)
MDKFLKDIIIEEKNRYLEKKISEIEKKLKKLSSFFDN